MYGGLKEYSYGRPSLAAILHGFDARESVSGVRRPRAKRRLCEPDQGYQQQEHEAQQAEYVADSQRRCLAGNDAIHVFGGAGAGDPMSRKLRLILLPTIVAISKVRGFY